jgi:tetratricopeptide (TPR) repeat protein
MFASARRTAGMKPRVAKTPGERTIITIGNRWHWIVPVMAGAVAFAPALLAGFVWDDPIIIYDQLPAFRTIADAFTVPAGLVEFSPVYFRPAIMLSFMADARIFDWQGAAGFHATNVVFHLATTFLLWQLARRLFGDEPAGASAALAAATLFAVHPIHVESVTWVSGRTDVLATLFVLCSCLLLLRWYQRDSLLALVLTPVAYLAAAFAKETALVAVAFFPVLLWVAMRAQTTAAAAPAPVSVPRRSPARTAEAAALVVSCGGAIWLYFWLRSSAASIPAMSIGAPGESIGRLTRAVAWYLVKLVWPWPQTNYVTWPMVPGPVRATAVLALGCAGLLAAAWWWRRRGEGVAFLGLWWLLVALAPSLLIVVTAGPAGTPVAERYLYLPSVGLALFAGALFVAAFRSSRAGTTAIALLALATVACVATIVRGRVWADDMSLWSDSASKAGEYALPWIRLARAYRQEGDAGRALQILIEARGYANTPEGRALLGNDMGWLRLERRETAISAELFAAAIREWPTLMSARIGLARTHIARAFETRAGTSLRPESIPHLRAAADEYETVLRNSQPDLATTLDYARLLGVLGDAYDASGEREPATRSYNAAVSLLDGILAREPPPDLLGEVLALRRRATAAASKQRL